MTRRHLTLIEVLQPQSFRITPERTRVTRTIVQPEIDAFEQLEAEMAKRQKKPGPAGRHVDPALTEASA